MITEYIVYIDSDGVIFDWDGYFYTVSGYHSHELPKGKVWKIIEDQNKTGKPFFRNLPKMSDADILIAFITQTFKHYAVLTATGYTPNDVEQQKRDCYIEHYPHLTVHCVKKSPDKAALFAASNVSLIDDRAKSIDPWVEAGGIGILHTDALSTIEKLKQIIG